VGDLVEIVTIDGARGGKANADRRDRPIRKERWRAVVMGPSVMGSGWWIVKKVNGRRSSSMTYTVPDTEMVRVGR
jgi:hypothetical protein